MKNKELREKLDILDGLISDTYLELIKDGKEYSFIRKALDDEDVNDASMEAMWCELTSRGDEVALPIIEMRNNIISDVFDVYVLDIDTLGITYIPVMWTDITEDIEYGGRLYDIATTWSKILLIKNMEEL